MSLGLRMLSKGGGHSAASSGMRLANLLGAGAIFFSAAAAAQVPSEPPPVSSVVDQNGVNLVSGQVVHSETILSIGQPGSGGLSYKRVNIGRHQRDNFTGTLNDVGTCALVSIGGGSEDCDSIAANGASLEDMGGGIFKYTMKDGTVAEFDAAWASSLPTRADDGRVTSITSPNGERLEFHYETVAADTVYLKSVTSNLGYQIKFSQTAPNTAVYAVNMAVDTCDPDAWTCTGLTAEVQPFTTASTYEAWTSSIRITPPSGVTRIYWLDTAASPNRVTKVTIGEGTWYYSYVDDTGADTRTTTVTDPFSNTRTVVSELSTGLILSDTNELGHTTTFEYDASDRLIKITRPEGNYTQFTHDSRGNVTEVRQVAKPGSGLSDIVRSATFPASCDSSNRLICNKPTSVTDERGKVTDFTYDPDHGGVLTITQPDPDGGGVRPQTRVTYDELYARYKDPTGAVVTAPAPVHLPAGGSACATGEAPGCLGTSNETTASVDYGDQSPSVASNLLPVGVSSGAGDGSLTATTALAYDAAGNTTSIDGPLPGTDDTSYFRYDANRQRTGVIGPDPDGAGSLKYRARRITYNVDGFPTLVERGTVTGVSDADWSNFVTLEKTVTEYDPYNRPVKRKRVANGATHALRQFSYDAASRLECTVIRMYPPSFSNPLASACDLHASNGGLPEADRIEKKFYDAAGRVTKVTQALGTPDQHDEKTLTWTQNGRVATLLDGNGNLTTYEYDGFGRVKKVFYPDAADGSASSTTDYKEYTYADGTDLLTVVRLRDGQLVSLTHDDLGRPTFVDKPSGEDDLTFGYDNLGRRVSANFAGHTVTTDYDALGRPVSETGPLGTIDRDFDAAGRRTRLEWPDSGFHVEYDYDLSGAMTKVRENGATSGAGVLATYAYDDLGRRVSITRGNGVATTYAYDDAQHLETLTHDLAGTGDDQTLTFARNPLGQIVGRTGSNAAFDWDDFVEESTAYSHNGLNQVSSAGATNFSYDGRGNLTSDGTKTYTYDVENHLTAVSGGATLGYDPLGRLYEVSDGVTATKFLTDGADVIAEYDASGSAVLRRYVHGAKMDEPLVWYEGSGTTDRRWLVADERGSIVAVTDDTATATTINTYDKFGTPDANNQGRFQYTGQMWLAEVGLYHYKNRTYAPGIGRFLQADPIGYVGGMNLYAYAGNDPVNNRDPFGLCSEEADICVTGKRISISFGFSPRLLLVGSGDSGGGGLSLGPGAGGAAPEHDERDPCGGLDCGQEEGDEGEEKESEEPKEPLVNACEAMGLGAVAVGIVAGGAFIVATVATGGTAAVAAGVAWGATGGALGMGAASTTCFIVKKR